MNPLPTRQECNAKMICAVIEAHNQYEDLFTYHEDQYQRYGEPVYEYEGVRAEGYRHSEDPTFVIRAEEATESDNTYIPDYEELVSNLSGWDSLESIDTFEGTQETEDGVEVEMMYKEFEVVGDEAEWLIPTALCYGGIDNSLPSDQELIAYCERNDLECFNMRNHFVVRGDAIEEDFRSDSYFTAKLRDRLDDEFHSGTSSANMNVFHP